MPSSTPILQTPILRDLHIYAYRGLRDLHLQELTPITLVLGANDAGKTSILEAAGLLLRPVDPAQWQHTVRHGALVDGIRGVFPAWSVDTAIAISGTTTANGPRSVRASLPAQADIDKARVGVSVNGQPEVTLKFPGDAPAHQVPMYRVRVHPAYQTRAALNVELGAEQLQIALGVLQVFDAGITGLHACGPSIRVEHCERGTVDLATLGEGARRALTLALSIAHASQGVLLIDELSACWHPSLVLPVFRALVSAARACKTQIIAATQSLEAVDALLETAEPHDLSAFWVRRPPPADVCRYDFERLRRFRREGHDVR